jgi:hypothetical protein
LNPSFLRMASLASLPWVMQDSTIAAFTDYVKKAARCFVAPGEYFSLINISDGFRLSLIPHLTVLL